MGMESDALGTVIVLAFGLGVIGLGVDEWRHERYARGGLLVVFGVVVLLAVARNAAGVS